MNGELTTSTSERAAALFDESITATRRWTDRLFAALMIGQWIFGTMLALVISPRTWIGQTSEVHIHVWASILLGGAITSVPVALALLRPGQTLTRHVVAAGQMLFAALLIHITGGRLETHFFIFGSLAFLAFYRDWKVLMTATAVVAIDHFVRGVFWPQSVFGVVLASNWRWAEHAGWVLFEVAFLARSCHRAVQEMHDIADRQAEIEAAKESVEQQVQERTLELTEARAAAETANLAKSEFLANMSHEIRTPMTSILGYLDLLRDPAAGEEERHEYAEVINRNGRHLMAIINDILDMSKIEAGKMNIERIPCSPVQILEEVFSMLGERAATKRIMLEQEHVWPLPTMIQSDPVRLRQILMNLISNAVKFTESGSVRVRLSYSAESLIAEVSDTGIGMTDEQVQRLFQPFTQADTSMTRRFGGSGLGLRIAKSLAEMIGGDITVTSQQGKGSVFTLRVHVGAVGEEDQAWSLDDVAKAAQSSVVSETDAAPVNEADLRLDHHILLAEDGVDNQRLISHLLRKAGAIVEVAENGRVAVQMAMRSLENGSPFDLILMDMQMPEMDGYTATSLLRRSGYTRPIVALTAHAMDDAREACIRAGCDDYASKPINRAKLISVCSHWVQKGAERHNEGPGAQAA